MHKNFEWVLKEFSREKILANSNSDALKQTRNGRVNKMDTPLRGTVRRTILLINKDLSTHDEEEIQLQIQEELFSARQNVTSLQYDLSKQEWLDERNSIIKSSDLSKIEKGFSEIYKKRLSTNKSYESVTWTHDV